MHCDVTLCAHVSQGQAPVACALAARAPVKLSQAHRWHGIKEGCCCICLLVHVSSLHPLPAASLPFLVLGPLKAKSLLNSVPMQLLPIPFDSLCTHAFQTCTPCSFTIILGFACFEQLKKPWVLSLQCASLLLFAWFVDGAPSIGQLCTVGGGRSCQDHR